MENNFRSVSEICIENRAQGKEFMDMFILKNDKPGFHGPMVHKETGESYQAMDARSEHEYQMRIKEQ